MSELLIFLAGTFAGGIIGIIFVALLIAAKDDKEE